MYIKQIMECLKILMKREKGFEEDIKQVIEISKMTKEEEQVFKENLGVAIEINNLLHIRDGVHYSNPMIKRMIDPGIKKMIMEGGKKKEQKSFSPNSYRNRKIK